MTSLHGMTKGVLEPPKPHGYAPVCVCVSVKSHLTSGASVRRENAPRTQQATKVKKCVAFSLELLRWQYRAFPPLAGHTYDRPFFLRVTRMRIVHTQVLQVSRCDARTPCRKFSLRSI